MPKPLLGLAAAGAAALVIVVLPGAGLADHTMSGAVGPGFEISLAGTGGIQPGVHDVVVDDRSEGHNFRLFGPAVERATGVAAVETVRWTLTFDAGTYTYLCDVHPTSLRGTFAVGSPPPPPPPLPPPPPSPPPAASLPTLRGIVGPGARLTLTTAEGRTVTSLAEGPYVVAVSDRSRQDNFHLSGPGVDRKTGVAATGTTMWRVRLKPGTYRARSDAHAALRRGFRVRR